MRNGPSVSDIYRDISTRPACSLSSPQSEKGGVFNAKIVEYLLTFDCVQFTRMSILLNFIMILINCLAAWREVSHQM